MIPFAPNEIDCTSDGHVHTRFCHHAMGDMEEYVKVGCHRGLREIIFLEHFETGINYPQGATWLTADDFQRYRAECQRLADVYGGQIKVRAGVEVGLNPHALSETKAFLARNRWARVGLSYHYFEHDGEHVNMLSRRQENIRRFADIGYDRVLDRYFNDLLLALDELEVDVLCHLDAPLRHCHGVHFATEHLYLIDEILVRMAQKKVALEINTSGFAVRGEPFPDAAIIDKARRYGLKFVAGSDAHRPEDVGRYFKRLTTSSLS